MMRIDPSFREPHANALGDQLTMYSKFAKYHVKQVCGQYPVVATAVEEANVEMAFMSITPYTT